MVLLPSGVGIRDGQAKPPVEGDGSLHVGHNKVELAWYGPAKMVSSLYDLTNGALRPRARRGLKASYCAW